MGVIPPINGAHYFIYGLFPRYGGYSIRFEIIFREFFGCFPVMGVILTQRSNKYYHVGCFPVMGVILGLPHKINEHNNLTRLEKLELALLDQHE